MVKKDRFEELFGDEMTQIFFGPSLANFVANNLFGEVEYFFRRAYFKDKIDAPVSPLNISATALEHAVLNCNWEMAFFLMTTMKASPEKNAYNGIVKMSDSEQDSAMIEWSPSFRPIPGYPGLKQLADVFLVGRELENMQGFLRLMEWMNEPSPTDDSHTVRTKIAGALKSLGDLNSPPHLWAGPLSARLKEKIALTQQLCRSHGLDKALSDEILSQVVKACMHEILRSSLSKFRSVPIY